MEVRCSHFVISSIHTFLSLHPPGQISSSPYSSNTQQATSDGREAAAGAVAVPYGAGGSRGHDVVLCGGGGDGGRDSGDGGDGAHVLGRDDGGRAPCAGQGAQHAHHGTAAILHGAHLQHLRHGTTPDDKIPPFACLFVYIYA